MNVLGKISSLHLFVQICVDHPLNRYNSMCNNTYNLERRIEKYPGTIVRVEKLIINPYYLNSTMNANYTAPADFCLAKVEKMNSNDRILNDKFIKGVVLVIFGISEASYG